VRIAQVVSSYYPQVGGVPTHVRRLAEGCVSAGDTVTVLTHGEANQPSEELVGPVRVLRFPLAVKSEAYPLSLELFRYLRRHAAEFDVAHAHSYHTLVGHAAIYGRLPLVFTPHYHGTGHTSLGVLFHRMYRPAGARLFAQARAIICVSQSERTLVTQDFPRAASKVLTIPNGTDPRDGPVTQSEDPGDVRMVLTIGRLERYKNFDLVIKAFRALPSDATLVIVGVGPDRTRLAQVASASEPGWPIRFTGKVSDRELGLLLAKASVVTSASDHEAFGLVLADGLVSGARVVASDIPAHREVSELAGSDAPVTFINPRDTVRFSAALEAALAAGRFHTECIRLPSWVEVVDRTRNVYSQVAADAGLLAVV
jgi:glycosyltransferase involved in cell wall biosynthesis